MEMKGERGQRNRQGTRAGFLTLGPSWHRGKAWSDDTSQLGPDKHARDVPSLDKYAEERWEVRTWDSVSLLVLLRLMALRGILLSIHFCSSGGPALHGGLPQCSRQPGLGSTPQPGWAHEEVRKPEVHEIPAKLSVWGGLGLQTVN